MSVGAQTRHDRYPGARPFADTEQDRRLYFGREREVDELSYQIIGSQLLVLFGKSGLGKTSLLQAGVFARLRQQDLLPLVIRLNQPERPVMEDFLTDIDEQCPAQGIDHTPGERSSLWEYFKTTAFWRNGALQTPVLVLDQFEEVFTLLPEDSRRRVAQELGQLLRTGLPAAVRARREQGEKLPYSEKPPLVKVVLSLREDYLGHLQELTAELPQILDNRFRLAPLDREAARRAVIEPAKQAQGGGLGTPAFQYSDAAVTEILDFLAGKSGEIEPFQLQVLCQHVEQKVAGTKMRGSQEIIIALGDLGGKSGMQRILQDFYKTALRRIHSRRQRKRARGLCEDGLLNQAGRRLSLEEAEIRGEYKVREQTLYSLVDARVLRREPRLDSFYYEISHDSLVTPILGARPWRVPRRLRTTLLTLVGVIVIGIFFLGFLGSAVLREQEAREAAFEARASAEELQGDLFWALRDKLIKHGHLNLLETVIQTAIDEYEDMGTAGAGAWGLANRAAVFHARGNLLSNRDQFDEALTDYRKAAGFEKAAIELAPKVPVYLSNLSIIYEDIGRVHELRGELSQALKNFDQERQALEDAMSIGSDDLQTNMGLAEDLAQSYNNLGRAYGRLGEYRRAIHYHEKARDIGETLAQANPNDALTSLLAATHGQLAYIELFNHNADAAIANAKKGLELDPSQTWISTNLAHAYLFDGQYQEAKRIYMENKNVSEQLAFADAVLADFKEFRRKGLSHPDMARIERILKRSREKIPMEFELMGVLPPVHVEGLALFCRRFGIHIRAEQLRG